MRTAYLPLLLAITFGASACARQEWAHATKAAEQFQADRYDCEAIAAGLTRARGYGGNPIIDAQEAARCLREKHGWQVVTSPR